MSAYYNEHDPFAAEWLRQLIKKGLIADGVVDTRSIVDVRPEDLRGFVQCHFFAGIGGWSYAARLAGWPDDRHLWSGSTPCQPFSEIGKGLGFADERHLWPHFHWLIENCNPVVVVGEQVATKDGLAWIDLVSADLEGSNYTSATLDLCAAGIGAPHRRQRLYWVGLDNSICTRLEGYARNEQRKSGRQIATRSTTASSIFGDGNPVDGFWANADWAACRDGKHRPVEPGISAMADGVSDRVELLRGYGNAIVAPLAAEFLEIVKETIDDLR